MKNNVDGFILAASIRMLRQSHKGGFFLVEGQNDVRIFQKFISHRCEIINCYNKKNALHAIDLLEDEGFPGVVCIVDQDFDLLEGNHPEEAMEGVFVTDAHDIDVMIFCSKALERYLDEVAFEIKLSGIGIDDVRNKVFSASRYLSYCRWASEKGALYIDFKDLEFSFISRVTLDVDEMLLRKELIKNSQSPVCTANQLANIVTHLSDDTHSNEQLSNGHDIARILGISLRELFGRRGEILSKGSEVERGLRLAYDYEIFRETRAFHKITAWESENKIYSILREFGDIAS